MQFIVQSRGINCPVESQKGAIPPLLSMTGIWVAPNRVPAQLPSLLSKALVAVHATGVKDCGLPRCCLANPRARLHKKSEKGGKCSAMI